MAQKFHQRFNIEVSLGQAERKFVNRVNNFVVHSLIFGVYRESESDHDSPLEKYLVQRLGERWKGRGCLQNTLVDDYHIHLRAIEALFENPRTRDVTDRAIKGILLDSEIDIGIRWDNGHFLFFRITAARRKARERCLGSFG